MDENKFEQFKADTSVKLGEIWNGTKQIVVDAVNWGFENPEKVVMILGISASILKASQSLIVSHRVRMERARIDHTWYDPSTGMHWQLCRKATNADRAMILKMKQSGMDAYTILKQLRLIK